MTGQTTNSNEGTSLLKEGIRLLESGDADAAIASFSSVIQNEPGRATAYRLRGSAHLRKRAYDTAVSDLDAAIKRAPKDAVAYYLRGRARQLSKDPARALADFDQAIKLKPDYLKAFQAREKALQEQQGKIGQSPTTHSIPSPPSEYATNLPPRWAKRFASIEKAARGEPISAWDRLRLFSLLGFILGPLYYFAFLGLHKKGFALLALGFAIGAVEIWFFPESKALSRLLNLVIPALAASLAVRDYHAFIMRKETMWPQLKFLDSRGAIAALLIVSIATTASPIVLAMDTEGAATTSARHSDDLDWAARQQPTSSPPRSAAMIPPKLKAWLTSDRKYPGYGDEIHFQSRDTREFTVRDIVVNKKRECTYIDEMIDIGSKPTPKDDEVIPFMLKQFAPPPPWKFTLGDQYTTVYRCDPVRIDVYTDLGSVSFEFD